MSHGEGPIQRETTHPGIRSPVGPIPAEDSGRYKVIQLEEGEAVIYTVGESNENAWVQSDCHIGLDHMR